MDLVIIFASLFFLFLEGLIIIRRLSVLRLEIKLLSGFCSLNVRIVCFQWLSFHSVLSRGLRWTIFGPNELKCYGTFAAIGIKNIGNFRKRYSKEKFGNFETLCYLGQERRVWRRCIEIFFKKNPGCETICLDSFKIKRDCLSYKISVLNVTL